jgi:hypothetical protein
MKNNIELKETIHRLTDNQLLDAIGEGSEAYRNGVFALYLKEAKARNISIKNMDIKKRIEDKKEQKIEEQARLLVTLSYVFIIFIGVYTGGKLMFRKKTNGDLYYPEEYGQRVRPAFITGLIFWGIVAVSIVYGFIANVFK